MDDTAIADALVQARDNLRQGEQAEPQIIGEEEVRNSVAENPQFSVQDMSEAQLDRAYFDAMEVGDEARMREVLNEVAQRRGYDTNEDWRYYHGAPVGGIEATDDEGNTVLYSWTLADEANNNPNRVNHISDSYYSSANINGSRDESMRAIQNAISAIRRGEDPMVTIYRAVPRNVKEGNVRNGDWVTMSRAYAVNHGQHVLGYNNYRIIEEQVPASQLYWDGNDINEWGFDDGKEYRYRNTKNNRKLDDLVTRDDNGNVIPPSKRFNNRNEDVRFSVNEEGAAGIVAQMEEKAEIAPVLELTKENWEKEFGKDNTVSTPLGIVKMGENQYAKLIRNKREGELGMTKPTLENPDVIVEKQAPSEGAERDTKYLFIKTFIKANGDRIVHYESVTVRQDGMEVSISSHEIDPNIVKKEIQNGVILHLNNKISLSSEGYLTEAPNRERPDLVPTSDISESKGRESSGNTQENLQGEGEFNTPQGEARFSVDEGAEKSLLNGLSKTDFESGTHQEGDTKLRKDSDNAKKETTPLAITDPSIQLRREHQNKVVDANIQRNSEYAKDDEDLFARAERIAQQYEQQREQQNGEAPIQFSVVEKDGVRTLIGIHNISAEKLEKAIRQGGLANPSTAVIDLSKQWHTGYGEISLLLPPQMIDSRTGRNAGTWLGDAWTPTYPETEKQISDKGRKQMQKDVESVPEEMQKHIRQCIVRWEQENELRPSTRDGLIYLFLNERGKAPALVYNEDGVVNPRATADSADTYIQLTHMENKFNYWLDGLYERWGATDVIFDGFTPAGNRRYIPATLENVSKWMTKQGRNGVSPYFGMGNFMAAVTENKKKIEDIRKNKGKLTSDEQKLKEFYDKWEPTIAELADKVKGEYDIDVGEWRLDEAIRKRNPRAWLKQEYGVDLTDEEEKNLKDFIEAVHKERPVRYFETKFERPVYLNEFAGAVIPNDASAGIKEALRNAGLKVVEYGLYEKSRQDAIRELATSEDLRFSVQEQERQDIIEKARQDGTLGKAPNGAESNLMRQGGEQLWATVRTPAFKNWFGDWESVAKAQAIEAIRPTSVESKPMTRQEAWDAYKQIGIVANKADNREVNFTNFSFKKSYKKNGLFVKAIPALKEAFENSILAYTTTDTLKGTKRKDGTIHKEHPNIKWYHNYIGKVRIDGNDYYARFTIKEERGKAKDNLHSTFVTNVELYKKGTTPLALTYPYYSTGETPNKVVDAKLQQFFDNARKNAENSSKVVDENGEPKVVYHNTNAQFTTFDETKIGTRNDSGWLGTGFYFYGDENEGWGYGRNQMKVFLNVKDPYYASNEENRSLAEANNREASQEFRDEVEEEGYDGVYFNGDLRQEIVVFNPNQVKSIDNNGNFSNVDNDIRFSAEEAPEAPQNEDLFARAERIANNYQQQRAQQREEAMRFRVKYDQESARDAYEQAVRSGLFQSVEALQDSQRSVFVAMKSILGQKRLHIEDVPDFMNAYTGENRLSSVNQAEMEIAARQLFTPLLREVARLAPTQQEHDTLVNYMMAKHGLERNRYMAERDARADYDEYQKITRRKSKKRRGSSMGILASRVY